MHPQIAGLLELQKLDSEIQAATAEIDRVPVAVAGIEGRAQGLRDRFEALRAGLSEAQKARRQLEGDLEQVKARLAKYQSQLMEVKTNEQYKVMLHEIDTTKAQIAEREERILEKMLAADEIEESLQGDAKQHDEALARLEREKKELEKRGAEAQARRTELQGQRAAITARVDPGVLRAYEGIASTRGGVAVVEAREELCMGCRVKLRPQVFQEIRVGTQLRQCDSCSRFLAYAEGSSKYGGDVAGSVPSPESSSDDTAP